MTKWICTAAMLLMLIACNDDKQSAATTDSRQENIQADNKQLAQLMAERLQEIITRY
jgi:lauroyl/myristoyl acyltransferase